MINAAVLGSPISHSLSPKIHSKAYEILGFEATYTAIEITEDQFPKFFAENSNGNWDGFSLTMPLKEVVLDCCKSVSDIAKQINSGNTLYKVGGDWRVTSTDYLAFNNLLDVMPGMNIAIIGSGGTARAAAGALDGKVDAVDVLLRSSNRVAAMSQAAPNVKIRALEMDAPLSSYDLIIQTTPVGAYDQYVEKLHDAPGLLLECLYKPWPTPLAARYAQLGGRVISGGQLLVEQALFQIELFSGNSFDFATMRRELLLHISAG